jgi:hypothetical protein
MKKIFLATILLVFTLPGFVSAESFLGVPLVDDCKILSKTDKKMEMATGMTHDQVLAFYKERLKDQRDIKYRDWKKATYIEDDGKLDWHSITIAKAGENGTNITIKKDSLKWIISTLFIRFIGIFIVLLCLYIGITVSGIIIRKIFQAKNE